MAEKNQFRTTYSVTIAYLTDEIYERLRHVDSQLGRGFGEMPSELPRNKLALCHERSAYTAINIRVGLREKRVAKSTELKPRMKGEEMRKLDAPSMSTVRSDSRSLVFPTR